MTTETPIQILGMGKYLPPKIVTAAEMDQKVGAAPGWSASAVGVQKRHFVEGETTSQMASKAIRTALEVSGLKAEDLDAIVSVSGTTEQPLPCTASLIAAEMGLKRGLMAFDVNATCLGFLVGLDLLATQVAKGTYKRVALVAAEIASVGLNWEQKESACLFGDGAVAMIIEAGSPDSSRILASHFETFSSGSRLCEIRGGSTAQHARLHSEESKTDFLFDMQGRRLFRLVLQEMSEFLKPLLHKAQLSLDDLDLVIPHQASLPALRLMRRHLKLSEDRFYINLHEQGNLIAASIPAALHEAREKGVVQKGSKVLLLGSSAGVSLGGVIIEL